MPWPSILPNVSKTGPKSLDWIYFFLKMRQKFKFNNEKSKIILTRPKWPVDNQMTANEGQLTARAWARGQQMPADYCQWRPDNCLEGHMIAVKG